MLVIFKVLLFYINHYKFDLVDTEESESLEGLKPEFLKYLEITYNNIMKMINLNQIYNQITLEIIKSINMFLRFGFYKLNLREKRKVNSPSKKKMGLLIISDNLEFQNLTKYLAKILEFDVVYEMSPFEMKNKKSKEIFIYSII